MHTLVFKWPEALVFWIVYIWAFAPEFGLVNRSRKTVAAGDSKDRGSLQVILIGMNIGLVAAFPLAAVKSLSFPPAWILPAYIIGIVMLIGGSLLRRYCWRLLGQYFTGDVQARNDQPVIDHGAYRWIRHPSYTGGILMFVAIGVALANWGSLAVLLVSSVGVYSYRVFAEERALLETIGEPYRQYMARTKRFVPFVV